MICDIVILTEQVVITLLSEATKDPGYQISTGSLIDFRDRACHPVFSIVWKCCPGKQAAFFCWYVRTYKLLSDTLLDETDVIRVVVDNRSPFHCVS